MNSSRDKVLYHAFVNDNRKINTLKGGHHLRTSHVHSLPSTHTRELDLASMLMSKYPALFSTLLRVQLLALMMVMLVVSMPLVHAASGEIHSIAVKGKDNVPGFLGVRDALMVEVVAKVDDSTAILNPNHLRIGDEVFSRCEAHVNGSKCFYRDPTNSTERSALRYSDHSVALTLSNTQDAETLDVKPFSFMVDGVGPTVTFLSAPNQELTQTEVTFDYTITDTACPSCGTNCSGIKSIQFRAHGAPFSQTVALNTNGTSCSLARDITIPTSQLGLGSRALIARALDMVGNPSNEVTLPFSIDRSGPLVIPATFRLTAQGYDLNATRPDIAIPSVASIVIEETSLLAGSVVGDFSSLNSNEASYASLAPASCSAISGNQTRCTWNLNVRVATSGAKSVRINASDTKGNVASAMPSWNIVTDSTGPRLTSLTPQGVAQNALGGSAYAGQTATLIGVFTESSGILASQVYLSAGSGSRVSASQCNGTTCVWNNFNFGVSSGAVSVSLDAGSTDILGNPASSFSQSFIISSTPPRIGNVSIGSLIGSDGIATRPVSVGDRILVIAKVSEDVGIASATLDVRSFAPSSAPVPGRCSEVVNGSVTCQFQAPAIENALRGNVELIVYDVAGNRDSKQVPLEVFAANSDSAPNFWTSSFSCSPNSLDRQLGPLVAQKSYCTINLASRSGGNLRTTSIELDSCVPSAQNVFDRAEVFNTASGSRTPTLKLQFLKRSITVADKVDITCQLKIYTLANGAVTRNAETETVTIPITFYNNPLGTIEDGVQKKLDDALKATEGIGGAIGTLNNLFELFSKLCQIILTLYTAVAAVYLLTEGLETASADCITSLSFLPFAATAICGTVDTMKSGMCVGEEAQQTAADISFFTVSGFCAFVNCQWAPGPLGEINKWTTDFVNKLPGSTYVSKSVGQGNSGYSSLLDIKESLVLSTAFACIPGIIYNLDKYRQIDCLYADCLQTAVIEDNIPLKVCEDLKRQTTCKYVVGEAFAGLIFPEIINKILETLKQALSDPLTMMGFAIGGICLWTCPPGPQTVAHPHKFCNAFNIASKLGTVLKQVQAIIKGGFSNRQDYCKRVKQQAAGSNN